MALDGIQGQDPLTSPKKPEARWGGMKGQGGKVSCCCVAGVWQIKKLDVGVGKRIDPSPSGGRVKEGGHRCRCGCHAQSQLPGQQEAQAVRTEA